MQYLLQYYDYINETTSTDIHDIEKKRFNIGTRMGLGEKIVYRIKTKGLRLFGTTKSDSYIGIICTAQNNIVVIKYAYVDKICNVLEDGVKMMDDEILKFYKTVDWCIRDYKKEHPQYKKYIFL